jgi:hypothetical protein
VVSPPPSISDVSAINPLVVFYDTHGRKGEVLFFYFIRDTTWDNWDTRKLYVQSTAPQTIQNCQTSPVDFHLIHFIIKHRFDWEYLTVCTNLSRCCPYALCVVNLNFFHDYYDIGIRCIYNIVIVVSINYSIMLTCLQLMNLFRIYYSLKMYKSS